MEKIEERPQAKPAADGRPGHPRFVREVFVFYGIGLLLLAVLVLLGFAIKVLLLIFAAILFAILLHDAGGWLQRWLPVSRSAALTAILLAAVVTLGGVGWLLAPLVTEQSSQLFEAIPASIQRLQDQLQRNGIFQKILGSLPTPETLLAESSAMLGQVGVFFSGLLGAVANAVIIIVVGIYLAWRPASYLDGFVTLVPIARRGRAYEILDKIGHALAGWLMGKLLSMVIVGVVTAIGLTLLDVPLALVLGILAGLLDFIPYIGPLLASLPAILIAFAESPLLALYVTLLFIALQSAEGYLLMPLIERRTVSLPPALTIIMQVMLGAFFGLAGVALATPLTATLVVLIGTLYVEDVLKDRVKMPGEDAG